MTSPSILARPAPPHAVRSRRLGSPSTRPTVLTESQLRRMLGFETRYELDGLLKERGVFLAYTMEDLQRERETLDRLGV